MSSPLCGIDHCQGPGAVCVLVRTRASRHSDDTPSWGLVWVCDHHSTTPPTRWAEATVARDDDGQQKKGRGL